MMFAFMRAYSKTTGQVMLGFAICDCQWCDYYERYVPNEGQMLSHFYRNPQRYGYKIGEIEIEEVRYIEIQPEDNLLLNEN